MRSNSIKHAIRFFILSVSFLAISTTAAQPVEELEYTGFMHTTFGDALLEINNEGRLEVSNIGSGGSDGFKIDLVDSTNFEIEWLELSGLNPPNNASIQIGTRATLAGEEEREIFTFMLMQAFLAERNNLRGVEISPDFSATGTQLYRYEFYNNGNLVESLVSDIGAIAAVKPGNPFTPWPTTARIYGNENGEIGYGLAWGIFTADVTFAIFFRDNVTLVGDEIRIFAADDVGTFSTLNEWNMWIGDHSNLVITREESF